MSESKTPRTDEESRRITLDCDDSCVEIYVKRDGKVVEGDIVVANFARQLERELNEAKAALSGRTVSCSNCNAMAEENAAMRAVIKDVYAVLDGCQEDTCELIAERDWWKTEPRCGYSARWAEMNARYAKAAVTLTKLQPYIK